MTGPLLGTTGVRDSRDLLYVVCSQAHQHRSQEPKIVKATALTYLVAKRDAARLGGVFAITTRKK